MTAQYAFYFDSTFCSGCKACQAACKDKNNLPPGVLWRRVIEVSGGAWQKNGEAWRSTVFAYNLSMACNHCVHPKCAGVCPVDAYVVREDGIVLLDTMKCMGCGYCSWACPYGAPQYNPDAGHMTKCDFCLDNLEQGLPPACVAACPMRVLDFGEATAGLGSATNQLALWDIPAEEHPYPLPTYSRAQPRLAIKLHAAMNRTENRSVANQEEIQPRLPSDWEEAPLIVFTLLGQMAAGGFWAMLWMFPAVRAQVKPDTTLLQLLPSLLIGLCLGAGMLASFAHLGTKKNAWRVLAHLRKSWLSREILFTLLFGMGWLFTTLESTLWHRITAEWLGLTAVLGFGMVYCMSQVYRLPSVPAWNTWRTNVGFMVSTLLLGHSLMASILATESKISGIQPPAGLWAWAGISMLAFLLVQLVSASRPSACPSANGLQIGLILVGMGMTATSFLLPNSGGTWMTILIFMIVLIEEGLGRWSFYRSRT